MYVAVRLYAVLGICSSVFWANRSFFFSKSWGNEWFAKTTSDSLIRSFLVSDLSDSLTSLIFNEQHEQFANIAHKKESKSESLILKNTYKKYDFSQIFLSESLVFCERKSKWAIRSEKMSDLLICSFKMGNLSESLFWHERPERFAHSPSLILSNLSESLTVAHLIWAIWANERKSKFPTLNIWYSQL